jgi:photosystem II stability/assembly factor-like uncharacterized protein
VRWQAVAVPTTASLRALALAGDGVVWVGGANGTLLRSDDGGAVWHDVAPRDCVGCDFRDLEVFDAHTALAMVSGQPARLYRTEDAGATWTIVHEDPRPEAFFDAMDFMTAGKFEHDDFNPDPSRELTSRGVLLGDPIDSVFTVLTSDDEGRTWRARPAEWRPGAAPGEAAFAASGTCVQRAGRMDTGYVSFVTGGDRVRFVMTGLGSERERSVDLPLRAGGPSRGAFSVAFQGQGPVVIVGGDYEDPLANEGTAAWSDDSGKTWHASETGAGGYRSCAAWLDTLRVLAVGSHGASISEDCGRTWRPFGDQGFHTVTALAGEIWACGSDGRVARLVR